MTQFRVVEKGQSTVVGKFYCDVQRSKGTVITKDTDCIFECMKVSNGDAIMKLIAGHAIYSPDENGAYPFSSLSTNWAEVEKLDETNNRRFVIAHGTDCDGLEKAEITIFETEEEANHSVISWNQASDGLGYTGVSFNDAAAYWHETELSHKYDFESFHEYVKMMEG